MGMPALLVIMISGPAMAGNLIADQPGGNCSLLPGPFQPDSGPPFLLRLHFSDE
jgi:hypothetical protein